MATLAKKPPSKQTIKKVKVDKQDGRQVANTSEEVAAQARVIKKYPNRRLYDTKTSAYVTLSEVKDLIVAGQNIQVLDAKTDENITRSIFLQIILEEESGGVPMLSEAVLAQLIRFYGHAMQGFMGNYLDKQFQTMAQMQSTWMKDLPSIMPGLPSLPAIAPVDPAAASTQVSQLFTQMQENAQDLFKQQTEQVMQMLGLKKP